MTDLNSNPKRTLQYGTGEATGERRSGTMVYGLGERLDEGAFAQTLVPARDVLGATTVKPLASRATVLPRTAVVDNRETLVSQERPRYEPQDVLGEGGIGVVHRAQDHDIARTVAVKRLRPGTVDAGTLARFVEEIRVVGQLEHPNIVPIHDVGVDERGDYFFVMKLVEGETLETIISRLAAGDPEAHRRYPYFRRLEIFLGILEAVHHAHQRGILHRDLKPANVMVGQSGEVMVMDWGIACRLEEAARASGSLMGTPLYMSPEQARSEPLDVRSDVYSLGVLLHELLTLRHYLADAGSLSEVLEGVQQRQPSTLSWLNGPHQPPVPMELFWYVKPALEKDPAKRYPDLGAMITRLKRRNAGFVPIQCHLTFTKRVNAEFFHWVDRHPLLFTSALAAGALGTLATVVLALLR